MSLYQNIFFLKLKTLTISNFFVSYLHMDHANLLCICQFYRMFPKKLFCQNIVYIWFEMSYFAWHYKKGKTIF